MLLPHLACIACSNRFMADVLCPVAGLSDPRAIDALNI
jgi:hypothetical protein